MFGAEGAEIFWKTGTQLCLQEAPLSAVGQPPQAERTATRKDTKLLIPCQSPWQALGEARDRFWLRNVSPRPCAAESCLLSSSPCPVTSHTAHHQPHPRVHGPAAPLGCCHLPWGSGCSQQQHLSLVSTPESMGGKKKCVCTSVSGCQRVHWQSVALTRWLCLLEDSAVSLCPRSGSLAPQPPLKMSR